MQCLAAKSQTGNLPGSSQLRFCWCCGQLLLLQIYAFIRNHYQPHEPPLLGPQNDDVLPQHQGQFPPAAARVNHLQLQ